MSIELSPDQATALDTLKTYDDNVFLTGSAGSGKSTLVRAYLKEKPLSEKERPVLASTGAAAVLVGGRTFHSFFGLGILQGGPDAAIRRALKSAKTLRRIRKAKEIIIDEVSMLSGEVLNTAEELARTARESKAPWGGLRILAIGDFAQLPPVQPWNAGGRERSRDWAFQSQAWRDSNPKVVFLKTCMRTQDQELLDALEDARAGSYSHRLERFLRARGRSDLAERSQAATVLLAHRERVDELNRIEVEKLKGPLKEMPTLYVGKAESIEQLKRNCPIPPMLALKPGALIMLRQNDPRGRWVNGTMGWVTSLPRTEGDSLRVQLSEGFEAMLERAHFTQLDGDGEPVASAYNFPVSLAYALTIHKAQGATLQEPWIDLTNLWEPGQAYVAMSRARTAKHLHVIGASRKSFRADPEVMAYYAKAILND